MISYSKHREAGVPRQRQFTRHYITRGRLVCRRDGGSHGAPPPTAGRQHARVIQ
jgi:hypothetical protein